MSERYVVYVLTNASWTRTLYVGVTNDLERRIAEHQEGTASTFTAKYRVHRLVYFEEFSSAREAIRREKQIKGWSREKKLRLVRTKNPRLESVGSDDARLLRAPKDVAEES